MTLDLPLPLGPTTHENDCSNPEVGHTRAHARADAIAGAGGRGRGELESGRGGSAQDGRGAGPSARRTRSALGRRRRCAGNARIGNRLLHCAHAAPTCRGPARRTRVLSCTRPRACPQAWLAPLARRCESLTCTLSALAERAHSQRARLSKRATLRHTITPPLPPALHHLAHPRPCALTRPPPLTLWNGPTRCAPAYDLKFSSTMSLMTRRCEGAAGATSGASAAMAVTRSRRGRLLRQPQGKGGGGARGEAAPAARAVATARAPGPLSNANRGGTHTRNHPRRTYREPLGSRDFAAAENAASARAPAPAKNARGRTPNGNIFFFFKDGRGRSRALRLTSPPVDFDFASRFLRRAVRRPPAALPPDFDPTSDSRFRRADRAAFALDPHPARDAKPQQEKKRSRWEALLRLRLFFVGRCASEGAVGSKEAEGREGGKEKKNAAAMKRNHTGSPYEDTGSTGRRTRVYRARRGA